MKWETGKAMQVGGLTAIFGKITENRENHDSLRSIASAGVHEMQLLLFISRKFIELCQLIHEFMNSLMMIIESIWQCCFIGTQVRG